MSECVVYFCVLCVCVCVRARTRVSLCALICIAPPAFPTLHVYFRQSDCLCLFVCERAHRSEIAHRSWTGVRGGRLPPSPRDKTWAAGSVYMILQHLCLSICLFLCLSVCLSVCLFLSLSSLTHRHTDTQTQTQTQTHHTEPVSSCQQSSDGPRCRKQRDLFCCG